MYKKIIFIIIAILVIIRFIYGISSIKKKNIESNDKLTFYTLQTHQYSNNNPNNKYYINSIDELNQFYSVYTNKLNINIDYLKDNSIFIETMQVSSGSITIKLLDVNFENSKVNFVIDKNIPEIGTDDMAFWYLVAIIPNDKLQGLNLKEWKRPSAVIKANKY